jgi:fumarate reductase subunit D
MTLSKVIYSVTGSFETLIGALLVSLIIIYFIWNTYKFMKASDETERADYRRAMIYSLVTITVAVSFWGIISLLQDTFGLNYGTNDIHKQVQTLFQK